MTMRLSDFYPTFDIDWAHDDVIRDLLTIVAHFGLKATWFATHETPVLNEIRSVSGQEIGIHPNFNASLEGKLGELHARDTIERVLAIVGSATAVRSHSLTRSSRLAALFHSLGLTHESNILIPASVGTDIKPWRDFSGLIAVPIRWEDDVSLVDQTHGQASSYLGQVKAFTTDFHPIHIFINSTTIDDYESSRVDARNPQALLARRRPAGSGGIRDQFLDLLRTVTELGSSVGTLSEIQVSG